MSVNNHHESQYMEIKSNQENLDLITSTEISDNPYGYYILWNRKQGTDVLNPNMYDIHTLIQWIETNKQRGQHPINPFTNLKLTLNEIKRIQYYYEIFLQYPHKQAYLDKLQELNSKIDITEIKDIPYNDIFRKIFIEIIKQNVSGNLIKMSKLKIRYDIKLLRAVMKPEFFTECFDNEISKDNYKNMDYREIAKSIVFNQENKIVQLFGDLRLNLLKIILCHLRSRILMIMKKVILILNLMQMVIGMA